MNEQWQFLDALDPGAHAPADRRRMGMWTDHSEDKAKAKVAKAKVAKAKKKKIKKSTYSMRIKGLKEEEIKSYEKDGWKFYKHLLQRDDGTWTWTYFQRKMTPKESESYEWTPDIRKGRW